MLKWLLLEWASIFEVSLIVVLWFYQLRKSCAPKTLLYLVVLADVLLLNKGVEPWNGCLRVLTVCSAFLILIISRLIFRDHRQHGRASLLGSEAISGLLLLQVGGWSLEDIIKGSTLALKQIYWAWRRIRRLQLVDWRAEHLLKCLEVGLLVQFGMHFPSIFCYFNRSSSSFQDV